MREMKRIAVGMSGGVDSSLSAALLKEQGYDVIGVFLECWKAPGCRAEEDRKDALSVALQLGIPFEVLDFKDTYKQKVVEYFFSEYSKGRTPNPDVMCNKEIKFGLFYDWAMEHGFDAVATGHYAQIAQRSSSSLYIKSDTQDLHCLLQSKDTKKDQSYFLYLLKQEQLSHILFPVGSLLKSEVRKKAKEMKIPVAEKPDSQGICFIGEINVHNFLKERLGEQPGNVVDTEGNVIGTHKGLWFYTIGQRHGFELKGKIRKQNNEWKHIIPPFYVIAKNAENNTLIVGFGKESLQQTFIVRNPHWIFPHIDLPSPVNTLQVRIRHTGKLYNATIAREGESYIVTLEEAIQGVAEGQSAVFYLHDVCLGGGVISVQTHA